MERPGESRISGQSRSLVEPRQREVGKLRSFPRLKKALLVVGMHRTGTSAMTRVLSLLGADLPQLLLEPVKGDNETGFWESAELHALHERLLAAAGSSWDDELRLPAGWEASEPVRAFRASVLELLRRDFAVSGLFVIKDPRLARLLPVWRTVLAEFGAEPHYVLTVRNPLEVAASLKARNQFLPAKSHLLWLWHLLEAERETRGGRRSLVLYDDLLRDWRQVAGRLESELGIRWPRRNLESEVRIDQFLSPRHRHHQSGAAELQQRGEVVDWAKRAYAAVLEALAGDDDSLAASLDRIHDELTTAEVAFGPLLAEGRVLLSRRERQVAELETRLETRTREAGRLEAELSEGTRRSLAAQRTIARLTGELAMWREELEGLDRQNARRDQELATARQEVGRLTAELGRLAGEVRAGESSRAEIRKTIEWLRGELGGRERKVGRLQRRLEELGAALKVHREQAVDLRTELSSLQWDVAIRDVEIRRLAGLAEARSAENRRLGETLDGAGAERQRLEDQLSRSRQRRAAVSAELAEVLAEVERLRGQVTVRDEELAARRLELGRVADQATLAQSAVADLEARLDGILGSRSWRFTRPLRRLAARWRSPFASSASGPAAPGGSPAPPGPVDAILAAGLFDAEHYRSQLADPEAAASDPLRHYLEHGVAERLDPHPLFCTGHYLESNPDVATEGLDPLRHFVLNGASEGRDPHPLFDASYYLERNPEVAATGRNPLGHFLARGASEGRDPHPLFDCSYYLQQNPDVAAAAENPLRHYLCGGASEGRDPHPLFDASYYLEHNPEVAAAGENPLWHFISRGASEGRDPHPLFDVSYYLEHNPEVAAAGENPLWHFISRGASEGRDPHPLFDVSYYLEHNPEVAAAGVNPLAHYLASGAAEGRDPHPLFSSSFYSERHPEVRAAGDNPLAHFVLRGAAEGWDPHRLFDVAFYLEQVPEASAGGDNPLSHYLRRGAAEGRDPHPLFDVSYYLEQSPELAASGENPLLHFLREGAAAGLTPHPLFDPHYYLTCNPDVARGGRNPLLHYLEAGAAEGRSPHPLFDADHYARTHPEAAAEGVGALEHYLRRYVLGRSRSQALPEASPPPPAPTTLSVRSLGEPGAPAVSGAPDTIVFVTHVPPHPPRAGNEYRLARLLRRLQAEGYRVVLALAPLGGEEIDDEQFAAIRERFPHAMLCGRDGAVLADLKELHGLVAALDGEGLRTFAGPLGEDRVVDGRQRELLQIDRTYCHDPLIQTVVPLVRGIGRCAVVAEYVFMTRMLPLVSGDCLKIVDTVDVFSSSYHKVVELGVDECLAMSPASERERLRRADLVVAIQSIEQDELRALAPDRKVIRVGVDFEVDREAAPAGEPMVCFVGSGNPRNVKGLRDFLRLAWPRVRRRVPAARLLVAGHVCAAESAGQAGVELLGPVDDLASLYRRSRVVVNPSVAGTGLKIKTLEALAHFRPVVNWPSGVEGMEPEAAELCLVAEDWYEFAGRVIEVLADPRPLWFSAPQQETIRRQLAAEAVYAPLLAELRSFFGRDRSR